MTSRESGKEVLDNCPTPFSVFWGDRSQPASKFNTTRSRNSLKLKKKRLEKGRGEEEKEIWSSIVVKHRNWWKHLHLRSPILRPSRLSPISYICCTRIEFRLLNIIVCTLRQRRPPLPNNIHNRHSSNRAPCDLTFHTRNSELTSLAPEMFLCE